MTEADIAKVIIIVNDRVARAEFNAERIACEARECLIAVGERLRVVEPAMKELQDKVKAMSDAKREETNPATESWIPWRAEIENRLRDVEGLPNLDKSATTQLQFQVINLGVALEKSKGIVSRLDVILSCALDRLSILEARVSANLPPQEYDAEKALLVINTRVDMIEGRFDSHLLNLHGCSEVSGAPVAPPKLAPCPFCGSDDLTKCGDDDYPKPISWVNCKKCDADGPKCATRASAIAAWNQRDYPEAKS